jgi:hypothetical protein
MWSKTPVDGMLSTDPGFPEAHWPTDLLGAKGSVRDSYPEPIAASGFGQIRIKRHATPWRPTGLQLSASLIQADESAPALK